MAERKTRRRTRAHLLREIDRLVKTNYIRQFKHYLVDRMLAEARRANHSEK